MFEYLRYNPFTNENVSVNPPDLAVIPVLYNMISREMRFKNVQIAIEIWDCFLDMPLNSFSTLGGKILSMFSCVDFVFQV